MSADFRIRTATPADVPLILRLIRALAVYEKMEDRVVATEDLLNEWIFEKKIANVLIAEVDGSAVGFALWFHNYDHSFPLRYKAQKGYEIQNRHAAFKNL
ncbi:MAG: hypothetical protein IJC93_07600 [Clostridia bacterium]|nr:hypothetical protein [Clostridia bacterium]